MLSTLLFFTRLVLLVPFSPREEADDDLVPLPGIDLVAHLQKSTPHGFCRSLCGYNTLSAGGYPRTLRNRGWSSPGQWTISTLTVRYGTPVF
jgi:hypothetical protein